ncbi:cell wall metabolism sensor histidine kinase WalK [Agrococcus sp. HG114]|uniref:sensor histidine kinase n=1 Tax=Agrococcus sp. HG114 TaxID=2969757 RepID=UPI00215A963F|nr:HAMP domain-containing sensor histidine kinase [Agrococcus sp. HG114]MCR8670278.1 HAMP domain-containing histidine kinase [Agrococcus sp. HG114]
MPEPARPRLRPWTVRSRIVGLLTLLSLVTVFVAGGVAYFAERARALEQIESNLRSALDSGSFIVGEAEWDSAEEALSAVVQRLAPDDNTGTLGIVDGQAALVPGIDTDVRLERLPGFVERVVAETAEHDVVVGTYAESGRTVRYLAAPVTVGEVDASAPPAAVFATGYDVAAELAELDGAARVFTITALATTAATFLLGLLVSDRLLRPIRRMREVAERSSAANLSERIPVGSGRDDVSQLAITVNGMLDRLGGAIDSQRELLRDVGHELKTPLTIVRGHLELVDERDPADVVATRELAIDELDRMAQLVDDLRAAARLRDPDAFDIRETDVAALVEQIAHKARAIDGAEIAPLVEAAPVHARLDPARITQAMLQLVANAVRHATGPIAIGARARGAELELFVRDRGPGVPDELKRVIFERFHRGLAEGRGDEGSGLGLAIVALIAERHGGTAAVADADGGSEFVLSLPRAVVVDARGAPAHPPDWTDTRETSTEEQPWHRS